MRRFLALAALVALTACGQGIPGIAARPPANPPSTQVRPPNPPQAAALNPQEKAQLESMVRGYLDQAQNTYAQGYQPAAGLNDEVTNLQPGTDHRYQVNLVGGMNYRIIGACDRECSNLDIELIDNTGSVVASDMAPDDFPVVNFLAPANGSFTVRILMQTCTLAPCYAGARALTSSPSGKGGAAPI